MQINNSDYLNGLLSKGLREQERDFLGYRGIKLEVGKIPHAEGSAQVDIGNTRVLVGVKIDVGDPMQDKPGEGTLTTGADLLPIASSAWEPGPPTPEAIEFARVVDRGIRAAEVIDTEALYIDEEKVWNVYMDLYVLNFDGNIFDAATLAGTAALLTAKQPRYEDEKVIRENMGKLKTKGIATSCTFAKVKSNVLLDPDANEEKIMQTRLTVANDETYIRAMQKGLSGAFTFGEISKIIETTFERSKDLRGILKKAVGD